MSAEWRRLSREAGLRVYGDAIEVGFQDGRRQTVYVDKGEKPRIRIWSVAAAPRVVAELDEPQLHAWRRNRLSELVGLSIDGGGRMIGEAWVPGERMTADEWGLYVRELAKACDRVEFVLSGMDDA